MTRFRRNPGFHAEVRATPGYIATLEATTTAVAAVIRENSPDKTGYYRRRVRPDGEQVVATDPFWHLVEFGSVNNPPYAPFRRGVIAAGLRLDERLR